MLITESKKTPEIRLFRSAQRGPVPFDDEMLDMKLPFSRPTELGPTGTSVSYREYLNEVKAFLLSNLDRLQHVVKERLPWCAHNIDRIDITAEKHGSDYHPAGVTVYCREAHAKFAVNAAFTARGAARLGSEVRSLSRLQVKYESVYVPRVHFMGEAVRDLDAGSEKVTGMFLADWFDGFHEFHLTGDERVGGNGAILWDLEQGYSRLSDHEMEEIYRQSAFILTFFYDLQSFEEIYPWHHAAGDFVVSRTPEGICVKLIAVRQYASRVQFDVTDASSRRSALLLFLANLTVRMRLDRIDGTGDIAWAGDSCLEATVRGFLDAMERKMEDGACDIGFYREFVRSLRTLSLEEATEFFAAVAQSYDEDAPDVPVVVEHLADHIFEFYRLTHEISEP